MIIFRGLGDWVPGLYLMTVIKVTNSWWFLSPVDLYLALVAADTMSTLSSSSQSAVVGVAAETGAFLQQRFESIEDTCVQAGKYAGKNPMRETRQRPLLHRSRIPRLPPGNRCRSAGLRTSLWCLASWRDTSRLQRSGSSSALSGCSR